MMSFLENTNRANDTLSLVVLNEYIYSILHLIIYIPLVLEGEHEICRRPTDQREVIGRIALNQELLE